MTTASPYTRIGTPSDLSVTKTQASHGFSTGNAVRFNGTSWVKAQSNSPDTTGVGIVVVIDPDVFKLYLYGPISGLSGLTSGEYHYVSSTSAGALTTTDPNQSDSSAGSNPILFADSTTTGYVLPWRPSQGGTSNPTTPNLTNYVIAKLSADTTTTSTSFVDVLSTSLTTVGSAIAIQWTCNGQITGGTYTGYIRVLVNGSAVPNGGGWQTVSTTWAMSCSGLCVVTGLTTGASQAVKLQWKVDSGGTFKVNASSVSDNQGLQLYVTER